MVPISLAVIFILLFIMFGNVKDSILVLTNVPFAVIGGIMALYISGTNFGISGGVGYIALFGICIQNSVILINEFQKNIKESLGLNKAIFEAIKIRTRPVVMTALMALIGFLPADICTGIVSESQKPLTIVIIGGLILVNFLTLLVFPIIFWFFNRTNYERIE